MQVTTIAVAPVKRSDGAELIAANIESRDHHAPWTKPFTDLEGFEIWFGQIITGPNFSLVAREGSSGSVVGVLNISQIVWGAFRSAYLGYYGMVAHARRGLMTLALRLGTSFAFAELGLYRLEANIQPAHAASMALVRRVGFQKEGFSPHYLMIGGVWRDHERWALLAGEPESSM